MDTVDHTYAAARRVTQDPTVAEDATQDAYTEMLAKWPKRQQEDKRRNGSYVRGIAVRRVYDHYRKRWRFTPLLDQHDVAVPQSDVAIELSVRTFLNGQPPRRGTIGILYYLEGLDVATIAELLGISESTVRTRLSELRPLLRSLGEEWKRRGGQV